MKSKWYSLLLVGLVLLLATSVMACGQPAPTPTPKPTPTPSPKPTSPIGQTEQKIEDGWVRIRIEDIGSIDYPADFLELQSKDYRDIAKETSPNLAALVFRLGKSDFTLQQVGLNDLLPSALNEYRRVMFRTDYLNPGEKVFRANEKYTMSRQELAEFQNVLINQLQQASAKLKTITIGQDDRIIDSGPLQIVEVNGMFPLVHIYKRQLNDNPIVLVKSYRFWNYDKIHNLIFSYRVVDEEECRDIYEKVLYSFRLKN